MCCPDIWVTAPKHKEASHDIHLQNMTGMCAETNDSLETHTMIPKK